MKRVQQGFTLIELMIVVAIVGILAAIALPAYQDFVVRSKMSEGTAALAACKTSVQDYTSSHSGTLPTTSDHGGLFDQHDRSTLTVAWTLAPAGVDDVPSRRTRARHCGAASTAR